MRFSAIKYFFLGVFVVLFTTSSFLAIFMFVKDRAYAGKIYPSVLIDGISQEGKSLSEAKTPYKDFNEKLKTLEFEVVFENTHVATLSGEMMSIRSNGESIVESAYKVTRSGSQIESFIKRFSAIAKLKKFSFTSSIEYSMTPFNDLVELLEKQYNIEPKNALFEIKNGKVAAFSQEKDGQKVEVDLAISNLRKSLSSIGSNREIPVKPVHIDITKSVVKPSVSLSGANNLGIEEVIGFGTSDYSGSIPERVHNLLLATQKIHGTLIPKGDTFSYNKTIGEISALTGYRPAYVIVNGRTVLGDGGGVCQTSTTLFRAALASGLPITDWYAHAYRVHYYENDGKPGRDATVYAPSVDLKFKNDTGSAILIQTESDVENNLLKYTFWGKKDDRKVFISDVTMGNAVPAPPPKDQEDPSLKKGIRKQVDWAASGLTTWFDYKVTKGSDLIQEKRFTSYYKPWQAVYLVGTAD